MRPLKFTHFMRYCFLVFILLLALQIFLPVIFSTLFCLAAYAEPISPVKNEPNQNQLQKASFLDDPDESLARAKEMVKSGNYEEALSTLYPFISKPMRYPTLFSDYLIILLWSGRSDQAISMYENLPDSFPKRPYLLRNMAKGYYDREDFLQAASLYLAVLEQTPLDEEAQKGLVLSCLQRGNLEQASNYLKKFLAINSDSYSLALIKAELSIKQGRYLEGLKTYHWLATRKGAESERLYKIRDDQIASLPAEERKKMLDSLAIAVPQGDEQVIKDYILVLILNKDFQGAVQAFETANIDLSRYPDHLLSWIAWAYFKTGDIGKAKPYYQRILDVRPDYIRAEIGLIYCLAAEGRNEEALENVDRLLSANPQNLEIRFARAFVHEKAGRFWSAIREYDRILKLSPENLVARRLRLRAWSDLGARSYALEEAYKDLPYDSELHDNLKGDMIADRIHWEEPKEAINLLLPLMKNEKKRRSKFDYIIALTKNNQMEEAIEVYENLIKEGITLPPWVLENAAKAYLYLEKPYQALELYDEALNIRPDSFNGRIGKFYVLQETGEWDQARSILDELDQEIPEVLGQGQNVQPNWPKMEIVLAKGWLFIYEGRLREAQDFFWNLYERAPANTGIRTGLAHVYLWRGWPRKALREFRIIDTLDPKYVKSQIGKVAALNQLAFKKEAREEANKLLATYPKDKHLRQQVRRLEVEEMRELAVNVNATNEEGGTDDLVAEVILSQPLSLYTKLYGFLLWQETRDDGQAAYFRRAGLGINHIFNGSWSLKQQLSANYDDGKDFGSLTEVNFYPDDYWRLSLAYDSFTTDVPIKARAFDIEAKEFDAGITYRESEWRSYHLGLSHFRFSDDNKREAALLGYEQGLWVKGNWKMRLFLDLYTSRNSRDDAPYFNPDHDLSLSATHMTEHIIWRIYNRAFVHRLFLTLGTYKQSGFSNYMTGAIRYEQDHDFSDTHGLLWGATLARNAYDGDLVNSYSFYLTYRWRF